MRLISLFSMDLVAVVAIVSRPRSVWRRLLRSTMIGRRAPAVDRVFSSRQDYFITHTHKYNVKHFQRVTSVTHFYI